MHDELCGNSNIPVVNNIRNVCGFIYFVSMTVSNEELYVAFFAQDSQTCLLHLKEMTRSKKY